SIYRFITFYSNFSLPTNIPPKNNYKPTHKIIEEDFEYINLVTTKYSEWRCINNQLQRVIQREGKIDLEYGGICGIEIEPSKKDTNFYDFINEYVWIFPIILLLLIIIILIMIMLVLSRHSVNSKNGMNNKKNNYTRYNSYY
ncbi:MAG: hypothetical protein QXJ28_00370, partial [Candidatus Pacearchaeota archaeon]